MKTEQFTTTLDSGTYTIAAEIYFAPRYSRACDDYDQVCTMTILKGAVQVDCDYIASQEAMYRGSPVDGEIIWGELADMAIEIANARRYAGCSASEAA